jgi:hypothetical protein
VVLKYCFWFLPLLAFGSLPSNLFIFIFLPSKKREKRLYRGMKSLVNPKGA